MAQRVTTGDRPGKRRRKTEALEPYTSVLAVLSATLFLVGVTLAKKKLGCEGGGPLEPNT
jgi:hypothetical protein